MTTQPLTPQNPVVIIVGRTETQVNDALAFYGIPTDAGNVEPAITLHKVHDVGTYNALIALNLSPSTPYAIACDPDLLPTLIRYGMEAYFGPPQTLASALSMVNNETVLRAKRSD